MMSKSSTTLPTSARTLALVEDSLKRHSSLSSLGPYKSTQNERTSPVTEVSRAKDSTSIQKPWTPTGTVPKSYNVTFGKKEKQFMKRTKSQECVLTKLVVAPSEIIDMQHQI